jgi:hypothetical protein
VPAASGGPQCGVEPLPAGLSSFPGERSGGGALAECFLSPCQVGNEFARRDEVREVTSTAHRSAQLTTAVHRISAGSSSAAASRWLRWAATGDPVTAKNSSLLLVGSASALELSRVAEAASYWPLSRAKRVRRVLGLPVLYVGDPFAPRRECWTHAEPAEVYRPRLVVPVPQVRLAPALGTSRLPGGGCTA